MSDTIAALPSAAAGSDVAPNMRKPRFSLPVLLGLALALLCSAAMQFITVTRTEVVDPLHADASSYTSYAWNLREFGVYSRTPEWAQRTGRVPTADTVSPPGYPLFLTLFLDGRPDRAFVHRVTLAQAALGVLTTFFVFLLAARVVAPGWAVGAATLTALTPHLSTLSSYLLTETLFTALLMISLWAGVRAVQQRRTRDWILAGILFGACCLVRPTLQALPPLLLVLVAALPKLRPYLRQTLLAVACWFTMLLPWLVFQQSIPVDTTQPSLLRATLYHGAFPNMMYDARPETYGIAFEHDPQAAEAMASNAGLQHVIGGRIREHPGRYLHWYLLGKPGTFLSWGIISGAADILIYSVSATPFDDLLLFRADHKLMRVLHWPLMLLGLAGALIAVIRPRKLALDDAARKGACVLAIVFLAVIALHMIGAPYPRYNIPFRPLAYVLATVALAALWARRRRS